MYNSIVMLSSGLSSAERTSTAGIVTLQGMLTIFAVLAILWAATDLMHRFLHRDKSASDTAKTNKDADVTATTTSKKETAENVAPMVATPAASTDDGAIIAAITAAIIAARAEEGNTGAFRVVSFKRAQNANRRSYF